MVREILIELYLFILKILFNMFQLLPLKEKVVFVVSFEQNSLYIYDEMKHQKIPYEVVFLCKSGCCNQFRKKNENTITFEPFHIIDFMKSIYHLSTSKYIIVDNYYAFLSVMNLRDNVQCIQIWHAAGAIKSFGFMDQSVRKRSKRAQKRFSRVYNRFEKVIVGSDEMAHVFTEAFHLPSDAIIRTGVPRTDLFFDKKEQEKKKQYLLSRYTELNNKKVILYAPTFRDNELDQFQLKLDIDLMYQELGKDYVLLVKLHPAIINKTYYNEQYPGFVYDFSDYKNVNELLLITDFLITDYSSIPFEFALLERPMIFYPYDLESYEKERGIWKEYEQLVPGPIVFTTKDIITLIKEDQFDLQAINDFSKKWNKYSNGHASENFVKFVFNS